MEWAGRPTRVVGRRPTATNPPPNLGIWAVLVSLVIIPWVMAYPKQVCFGTWASLCLSLILMLWLVAHFALICGVWFLAHEVCFLP